MLGVTGAVYVTSLPGVVWRRNQAWFGILFVVMHSPVLLFIVDSTALAHPSVLEGVKLSLFGSLCGIVGAVIYGGCVLCCCAVHSLCLSPRFTMVHGCATACRRIPERWFPAGTFDLLVYSHVIWHVLTAVGPMLCLIAGKHYLAYAKSQTCSDLATVRGPDVSMDHFLHQAF